MHYACLVQENELAVGREKQIGHNEDMNYYEGFEIHAHAWKTNPHHHPILMASIYDT